MQRAFTDDSPRGLQEESGVSGNDELAEEIFRGDNSMDTNHTRNENGISIASTHKVIPYLLGIEET